MERKGKDKKGKRKERKEKGRRRGCKESDRIAFEINLYIVVFVEFEFLYLSRSE